MRPTALLALLTLVALAFAGCSGGKDDGGDGASSSSTSSSHSTSASVSASVSASASGTSTASSSSSSSTGPANSAPTGSISASVNGTSATFALNATDADGDPLTWELDFGDGSGNADGSTLPANETHTYAIGNYTATFTFTDGKDSVNRSATVRIEASGSPAPTGEPVTWSGYGVGTPAGCLSADADQTAYFYFDETFAGAWTYTVTSTVPMATILTEWWAGDTFVANQGATGIIPVGADNVAVCGDAPTLAIDFTLTLSPT